LAAVPAATLVTRVTISNFGSTQPLHALYPGHFRVLYGFLASSRRSQTAVLNEVGTMLTTPAAVDALPPGPRANRLLAALPSSTYEVLLPQLEAVAMPLGLSVYESGAAQGYVYFPTDSLVSLLCVLESGASAEIAVTGNEGLVGIALFMGGETTPSRAVVQSGGHGYRLKGEHLKKNFEAGGPLQHLLLRYTQALITQMTQTAVCNRHHSVDQQLCRWLLLSLDRLPGKTLVMTQELIANMLGVRREGVTEAAGKLQIDGLIEYSRGKITVLDRVRLEARVCECYAVVRREYDRLLPEVITPS
jgi:CRP-like cAMP-binding protein